MHRVIILCFPLIFLFVVDSFSIEKKITGVCSEVVDGDTIKVDGQVIRLAGIDAPELSQKSLDGFQIGEMSKRYLMERIVHKKVTVLYRKRGKYGRILGWVYFLGHNINEEMVRKGMALSYQIETSHSIRALEMISRFRRKGIFGTDGFMYPYYYRKESRK